MGKLYGNVILHRSQHKFCCTDYFLAFSVRIQSAMTKRYMLGVLRSDGIYLLTMQAMFYAKLRSCTRSVETYSHVRLLEIALGTFSGWKLSITGQDDT